MIRWLKNLFRGGLAYGPTTLVPKMTTSDLAQGIMHYADDERYMINIDRGIHMDGGELVPVVVHYFRKDGTVYYQPARIKWDVDTSDKVIIIEALCKSVRSIAERRATDTTEEFWSFYNKLPYIDKVATKPFSDYMPLNEKSPDQPSPPEGSN